MGGGGLLGGVAAWYQNRIDLIGVEPELAPTLTRALEAGRPVDAEAGGIAADSLAPKRVGELMFPIAQKYVKEALLVTDESIREAQAALWNVLRVVAARERPRRRASPILMGPYSWIPGSRLRRAPE